MSILINKHTKVITQGITGKAGQFHTRICREYGNGKNCFVAGVHPQKAGADFEGIPIYGTVKEAKDRTGATVSVIYVPPPSAAAAIDEAVDAGMELVICITEGIPMHDMIRTAKHMQGKKTILLGPSCSGLITPGEIKVGVMPGHIHKKGRIGVVSSSETLAYEAVSQLTEIGFGQSTCVAIGDDPVHGIKHIDVMRMFNDDPDTEAVVLVGEIGGDAEENCARWIRDNMKKPVIGFIAGMSVPPGKRIGHASAIVSHGRGTAEEKLAIMEDCGIATTRDPADIGKLLRSVLYEDAFWMIS